MEETDILKINDDDDDDVQSTKLLGFPHNFFVRLECHTGELFSNTGRIIVI